MLKTWEECKLIKGTINFKNQKGYFKMKNLNQEKQENGNMKKKPF